jgi:hypothetical protein
MLDSKSIVTIGYWPTTLTEIYPRVSSWGYWDGVSVSGLTGIYKKSWIAPYASMKLRR